MTQGPMLLAMFALQSLAAAPPSTTRSSPVPPPSPPALAPAPAPAKAAGARVVRPFASAFGTVYVVDEGHMRFLRFDDPDAADQSVLNLRKPDDVALEYVRVAALSLALAKAPRRVLVIGMGGGTFTRMVRRHVTSAVTDAVEIDPVVVEVAKDWFGLVEDQRTRVHITDGAAFLASARGKYDIIFLDAYDGEDFPAHLASEAFFRLVKGRLGEGGVAVMNLAVEDEKIAAGIFGRWQAVFPSCLRVREPVYGNVLAFGREQDPHWDAGELLQRARAADRAYGLTFQSETFARSATDCEVPKVTR